MLEGKSNTSEKKDSTNEDDLSDPRLLKAISRNMSLIWVTEKIEGKKVYSDYTTNELTLKAAYLEGNFGYITYIFTEKIFLIRL